MKRTSTYLAPVLAVLLLTAMLAAPASAASKSITINPGIHICLDGQTLNPTDARGNPVEVFSCEGTTYLPVRAISQALGLSVSWDAAANRVNITKSGTATPSTGGASGQTNTTPRTITVTTGISIYLDGQKLTPKDANGKTVEVFAYNGTTYLPVRAIGEALGLKVGWDGPSNSVLIGEQTAPGQSSGTPAGYVHPSTLNKDLIFGVWELNCETWTQASKDEHGTWAWFTFRPDGTVDFLSQNLELSGTYVVKPQANADKGEPYAIITFPERVCEVTIYHMYMDVYNLPEVSYAVQVGSHTNTGTQNCWAFTQYSDEELFGAPD